jgi:purine-binding chemotaxis protein CheW
MAAAISTPSMSIVPAPVKQLTGKHLIFQLGTEEFAINVMNVKEIMKMQPITVVPQTPSFVQGVINLRGKIVPVINLRRKFGIEDREYTELTCIVVVRMRVEGGEQPVGVVVDGVVEVLTFNAEDIEDTPDFGLDGMMPYVRGMAKVKGRVKIVLDIDQVLQTSPGRANELSLVNTDTTQGMRF